MDVDEYDTEIILRNLSHCSRPTWQLDPIPNVTEKRISAITDIHCCEGRNTWVRIDGRGRALDRRTMDDIQASGDRGKTYFMAKKFKCSGTYLDLAWVNILHFENDVNVQFLELFMTIAQSSLEQMKLDLAVASKEDPTHVPRIGRLRGTSMYGMQADYLLVLTKRWYRSTKHSSQINAYVHSLIADIRLMTRRYETAIMQVNTSLEFMEKAGLEDTGLLAVNYYKLYIGYSRHNAETMDRLLAAIYLEKAKYAYRDRLNKLQSLVTTKQFSAKAVQNQIENIQLILQTLETNDISIIETFLRESFLLYYPALYEFQCPKKHPFFKNHFVCI